MLDKKLDHFRSSQYFYPVYPNNLAYHLGRPAVTAPHSRPEIWEDNEIILKFICDLMMLVV